MPTSDAIRLKRLEIKSARQLAEIEALKACGQGFLEIIKNPVVEAVGAYSIVEILYRYPEKRPIVGDSIRRDFLLNSLAAMITAQQLAPLLPALGQGISSIISAVTASIPKLK